MRKNTTNENMVNKYNFLPVINCKGVINSGFRNYFPQSLRRNTRSELQTFVGSASRQVPQSCREHRITVYCFLIRGPLSEVDDDMCPRPIENNSDNPRNMESVLLTPRCACTYPAREAIVYTNKISFVSFSQEKNTKLYWLTQPHFVWEPFWPALVCVVDG